MKKLHAFNGEYIRALSIADFIATCRPWLTAEDVPWNADRYNEDAFIKVAELVQTRVVTLSEVPAMVDFLFLDTPIIDEQAFAKTFAAEFAAPVLERCRTAYASIDWTHDALKLHLDALSEELVVKLGKLQAPLRVAVTGRTVGPPLFESLEVLGREQTLRRINDALSRSV